MQRCEKKIYMTNKNENWERLESVIRWANMTINYFGRYIGLSRSENLYQIKRGNNGVSLDLANRITAKFPEVSKLWLLTGDSQMISGDAPAGPWSNIGTPNSEAFIGFAAALILPKSVNKSECRDPYMVAVNHAEKLMAALAKKGGEQ